MFNFADVSIHVYISLIDIVHVLKFIMKHPSAIVDPYLLCDKPVHNANMNSSDKKAVQIIIYSFYHYGPSVKVSNTHTLLFTDNWPFISQKWDTDVASVIV